MKRSRFSDEQIIAIVKEQEAGMATAERPRLGFRRLGYLLAREGHRVSAPAAL